MAKLKAFQQENDNEVNNHRSKRDQSDSVADSDHEIQNPPKLKIKKKSSHNVRQPDQVKVIKAKNPTNINKIKQRSES